MQQPPPYDSSSYEPSQPSQPSQPLLYTSSIVWTEYPQQYVCPYCHYYGFTETSKKIGAATWLTFSGCLLFGCWFGCCLIPFCLDDLKDTIHRCANCHRMVGYKTSI